MSADPNTEISIEFLLRQIDQALTEKNIEAAEKLLADARSHVQPGAPEDSTVQRQEREILKIRVAAIASLEETIRNLFARVPIPDEELEREIDALHRLQPEHGSLAAWRNKLVEYRREKRTESQIQVMESDLKRRWQEAEEAEKTGLIARPLIALYEQIRDYAQREASNIAHPRADALMYLAERRLMEIRLLHYDQPSKVQAGQFRELIEMYRRLDPTTEVPIALDYRKVDETLQKKPAREAVEILERQARDYAAERAGIYRDNAIKQLEEHAPGPADGWLLKALNDLYLLDEEERKKITNLRDTRVKPALEKRESASRILREAETQGDPQEAWKLLVSARDVDPYAPNLEDVRREVVGRVKTYLDVQLDEAQQRLTGSDAPDYETALSIAGEARKLAGQDVQFGAQLNKADALLVEANSWKRLGSEIKAAISDAEGKKDAQPEIAYEGLRARAAGWGDRAKRFKALSDTLATLEARVNVNALLARSAESLKEIALEKVQEALRACDVAIKESPPRQSELEGVRRRLDLHFRFLQGSALLSKPTRTSADEQSGLKLLQEVIDGRGDDLTAAQDLKKTIKSDREKEEKTAEALRMGRQYLNQKRYGEAYDQLKPYEDRSEFADSLKDVTTAWEVQLLKQLGDALSAPRINEVQIKNWANDLEKLGSPQAAEFKARVIGRAAAQRAQDLERMPNKKWDDILAAWEEAVIAEPTNTSYQAAQQNADKQQAFLKIGAFSIGDQIVELEALVGRYPADLEVRMRLVDTMVKHIHVLRNLEEIERTVIQAQTQIAKAEQMVDGTESGRRVQAHLNEQTKTLQIAMDVAQRKNDIEQGLKADRLLDSWKRAKGQADELLKTFPERRELTTWARSTLNDALQRAQGQLKEKTTAGTDVWDKVRPAAQVLILSEDNVEARQQVQAVYEAVTILDAKQTALEKDTSGAAYPGDGHQSLVDHLQDANTLRNKLLLAEQVLMLFGGFVHDAEGLRNQVNKVQARNNLLIEHLEQVQRYLNSMKATILSARSDDSDDAWYPTEAQYKSIRDLGYEKHRAVLAVLEEKKQAQQKQQYLRQMRERITDAIKNGNTAEAQRWAELMRRPGDRMADPEDKFAEQGRFRVQEPYTKRWLTSLDDIMELLKAQRSQIDQLKSWLPLIPEPPTSQSSPNIFKVNKPLIRWEQVKSQVDEALRKGAFDTARGLIDQALDGEINPNRVPTGKVGEAQALNIAFGWLAKPVVSEQELNSTEARRLWDYSRQLFRDIQSDREAALVKRNEVDRLENEWQEAWQRFMGAVSVVDFETQRPLFERLRPSWRTELAAFKQTARMEYNHCTTICPEHPDLTGWNGSPMLG